MSEEKIIDVIETVIIANRFDGVYTSIDIIIEAMKGLLDLYEEEKEKNRYLKSQIPRDRIFYFSEADYVSKNEIRKRMEQTKKVYDEEIKPYMIEVGNGEKVLNVTGLNKKEKAELINKRNCLLVQIKTYEMLLEDKNE